MHTVNQFGEHHCC